MDRLLEDSVVRSERGTRGEGQAYRLPLDVYTTEDEILVVASLPGLTADDVDITIEGDSLTIRGTLRPPLENVNYIFQERPYGTLTRTLNINVPVDVEAAEASFENGVLTVALPKAEEMKPKTIKVK
jgi:HSP20 family protein